MNYSCGAANRAGIDDVGFSSAFTKGANFEGAFRLFDHFMCFHVFLSLTSDILVLLTRYSLANCTFVPVAVRISFMSTSLNFANECFSPLGVDISPLS